MRALPLLAYATLVFLVAAGLAYPAWLALGWIGLEAIPFHKLHFRLLEVCALLGLYPLLCSLGINDREHWGFGPGRGAAAATPFHVGLTRGFLAGVAMLFVLVLALWILGIRELRPALDLRPMSLAAGLGSALGAALIVGVVEEVWFRGALHGALARIWNLAAAVAVIACFYGAVHFVRPDWRIEPEEIDWASGFVLTSHLFDRFARPEIVDSGLALILAGLVLGLVRTRTGRMAECIGLHAGWVLVIRLTRTHTELNPQSRWSILVGEYDGVLGWLACGVFASVLLATWLPARRLVHQASTRGP